MKFFYYVRYERQSYSWTIFGQAEGQGDSITWLCGGIGYTTAEEAKESAISFALSQYKVTLQ